MSPSTDKIINEISGMILERRVALFAGSGLSACLGLPTLGKLLRELAVDLDLDPDDFERLGDPQQLAEYYVRGKGSIGPLRSRLDSSWHGAEFDVEKSRAHSLIVDLDFPLIYTTNWDRWIERAFEAKGKKYHRVTNAREIAACPVGVTEIVKFHGDFESDESIVLTESAHMGRLGFETALDLKLRSDSIRYGLLFIGTSLADYNIRFLLYKLQQLWNAEPTVGGRPPSWILLPKANPVAEDVLRDRGLTPIIAQEEDLEEGLVRFLQSLWDALQRQEPGDR